MRVFLLMFISASSFGQILFEKGYLIDNNGKRIECLIKNNDWKDNPTEFYYKTSSNDSLRTGDLKTVKEFQVYGYSKYICADVKIDRSKTLVSDLSHHKNPDWSQEKLFLKALIESKASLYSYSEGNMSRFFYSTSSVAIEQLIFKEYLIGQSTIGTNNFYKNQLSLNVKCKNQGMSSLANLRYSKNELSKYFVKYNQCEGDSVVGRSAKKRRNAFQLKLTPGLNYSSLRITDHGSYFGEIDFNNAINFRLGAELEYVFPFNKNKWSFVFEPTYQSLSSKGSTRQSSISYNAIEFPIGIRYYFFLQRDVKIFLNAFYISPFIYRQHGTIDLPLPGNYHYFIEPKGSGCFALGSGFQFKSLMSLEARYYSNQELLNEYVTWSSNYGRLAVILGISLFKGKTK